MKTDIHPKYFPKAKITCACGHVFIVGATQEEIQTDICSNCHPFYTGKEKMLDIAGRIEKFKTKQTKKVAGLKTSKEKKAHKATSKGAAKKVNAKA